MDRSQGGVAVPHAVDDHPDPHQVVDLVERPPLHDHLLVDAPELLGPAGHPAGNSQLGQTALHLADQLCQVEVPLRRTVLDHLVDLAVPLGMQRGQRQVLELVLHLLHSQPVGQRGVDVHGLLGHALLLVLREGGQGPHVVEAVGQLDYQDAEVLGERHQHLSHAGRLLLLPRVEVEPVQLGHAVHDQADLRAEVPLQVIQADRGVLNGIVEEGGRNRGVVKPLAGDDGGDGHRMVDVRLARLADLPGMCRQGHLVRPLYERGVGADVSVPELGEQRRGLLDRRPGAAAPGQDPGHRRHDTYPVMALPPPCLRWASWSCRLVRPEQGPIWGRSASSRDSRILQR